jgi:hypothetical protein
MRKLFSKYNLIATVIVVQLIASGCKDSLLDVEPRDRLTETTLWGDKGSTTLFLNDVYEGLPDGNNWYDPVENWSDNSICGFPWPGSRKIVQEMLMNPTSIPGGDVGNIYAWATNYANIRKCNVYIKNVTASNLDTDFKKTTLAEVRVLRAYYYQMLYMAYGGMPIITEVLDQAQGDAIFKPRSTADETLQFITKECTEAYVDLPETPMSGSVGREQRFYQSINFDGCYWYNINLSMRDNATNAIDLADKNDASQTGYYMRKRLNDKLVLGAPAWTSATAQSNQNYNIFRYAEVLLNYAEAQNEAIGADASVYIAIGKIRTRAGLPNLPEGLSQADMRTAIRRERRIELALEDKRYWDLIRWKIAEVNLNKPLHGMKITTSGATVTYTVVPAVGGNRKFAPKNYLFPIPQDVINQNKQIKGNNPGY